MQRNLDLHGHTFVKKSEGISKGAGSENKRIVIILLRSKMKIFPSRTELDGLAATSPPS